MTNLNSSSNSNLNLSTLIEQFEEDVVKMRTDLFTASGIYPKSKLWGTILGKLNAFKNCVKNFMHEASVYHNYSFDLLEAAKKHGTNDCWLQNLPYNSDLHKWTWSIVSSMNKESAIRNCASLPESLQKYGMEIVIEHWWCRATKQHTLIFLNKYANQSSSQDLGYRTLHGEYGECGVISRDELLASSSTVLDDLNKIKCNNAPAYFANSATEITCPYL